MRQRLATIGDNCIDRFLPVGLSAVGGNAVNVGVHLRRAGWDCAYFGATGGDSDGDRTRAVLEANGLDLTYLQVLPGITSFTDLDVDSDGERFILHENFGVCADYQPDASAVTALRRMRHVHVGWLKHARQLAAELAGSGVTISQDVAVNSEGGGLDIAFGSVGPSEEAALATMRSLLEAGNRIAVVTCGPLGSFASDGKQTVRTGVRPVDVVDTTGAGDTFIAGFIAAHLAGSSLQEAIEAGRDSAAETCRHFGGFPQQCARIG
ncbi:MAG: PfkB family carbohydrate kinase [Beijerinckiaceae bacterium]